MEDVVEVWPTGPGPEFLAHLLAQEFCPGPLFDQRERKLCVQWINRACVDYGFTANVGGLATKFFDVFLAGARSQAKCGLRELTFKQLIVKVSGYILDMNKHNESALCELLCIVCIAIAAKKVEPKARGPYLGDFDENFTFEELKAAEALVLCQLRWNISYSTPYEFVQHWLAQLPAGLEQNKCQSVCFEVITTCIPESNFYDKRPSVFGAGALLWGLTAAGEIETAKWENELTSQLGASFMESAMVMQDDISFNETLRHKYPQACKPRRAPTPHHVMDLHLQFDNVVNPTAGLKRPVAERFDAQTTAPKVSKSSDATDVHVQRKPTTSC